MLPRSFMSGISAESRCQWASHGSLPLRFAIQGYCWWNSRFRYGFVAIRNNYLRGFTSHDFTEVDASHFACWKWTIERVLLVGGNRLVFLARPVDNYRLREFPGPREHKR